MLPHEPAVRGVVMPETTSLERAAAFTTMPAWEPVMVAVTLSVAVTDCVPAVLRITLKTWVPASAAVNL